MLLAEVILTMSFAHDPIGGTPATVAGLATTKLLKSNLVFQMEIKIKTELSNLIVINMVYVSQCRRADHVLPSQTS